MDIELNGAVTSAEKPENIEVAPTAKELIALEQTAQRIP
jgi:hypothetical protein